MGQSAGIAHSAASDITQLRKLLDDSYSDTSVFRELTQNADDAQATWVIVSYVENGPSGHPLLSGPGVLVINNGFFRRADDEAIRRLGAGTKGGDAAAIGKFGLGLKSVFHWCEAFFYLASPGQDGARGATFCRLFNPWGDMRPEWDGDHFEQNLAPLVTQAITKAFETESQCVQGGGDSRWFALYIPLRRSIQWQSNEGGTSARSPIRAGEPNSVTLFPQNLWSDVADLLPLLRRVRDIRFHLPKCGYSATLVDGSTRTVGPDECGKQTSGKERVFSGSVRIEHDGAVPQQLDFLGTEFLASRDPIFPQMRDRADWPKIMAFDAATEESKDQKEKGEPHGAVVFSRTALAGDGSVLSGLTVQDAVFLPLEGGVFWSFGAARVRLLMHGFYFVDSGRRALHRGGDIQTSWNDAVRRRVTLPLVLPALRRFVEESNFDTAAIADLTAGLDRTLATLSEHRQALLRDNQWLPCLTAEANPSINYCLRPAVEPYYEIPRPPRGSSLAYSLFPDLRDLARKHNLVFHNDPRLTLYGSESLVTLSDYFAECNVAIAYENEDRRRYLKTLISHISVTLRPAVWAKILGAFSTTLIGSRSEFQRANQIASDIIEMLRALPEEYLEQIRPAIQNIPLFRVVDNSAMQQGEPSSRLASWTELDQARIEDLLFANANKDVAEALQRALSSGKVLRVVDNSVSSLLFGSSHGIGNCDADACLQLLSNKPLLAVPARRVALLKKVIPEKDSGFQGISRKALRYLLHGEPGKFEDVSSSLLASDETQENNNDVWSRIARVILDGGLAKWRVIDKALSDELTLKSKEKMGVDSFGAAWVESVFREKRANMDAAEFADFVADLPWQPEQDALVVLSHFVQSPFFKLLPLHQKLNEEYVALTESCYRASDCLVPHRLEGAVTLIREPSNALIRESYLGAKIYAFAPRYIITVALNQPQPAQYYREILDATQAMLDDGTAILDELLDRLRSTRWMPLQAPPTSASGEAQLGAVQPYEVIDLPSAGDALARLMASPEISRAYATPDVIHRDVREHSIFPFIRENCFAHGRAVIEQLVLCVETWASLQERGFGGILTQDCSEETVREFLNVFADLPDTVAPELALVRAFFTAADVGPTSTVRIIRDSLALPVPDGTLVQMINFLAEENARGRQASVALQPVLRWYQTMLRLLRSRYSEPFVKFDLKLRSKSGEWQTAGRLCYAIPNAIDGWLLEPETETILFGQRSQHPVHGDAFSSGAPLEKTIDAQSAIVKRVGKLDRVTDSDRRAGEAYLKEWAAQIPPEIIGAFLAVFANNREAQQQADQYLGHPGDAVALRTRLLPGRSLEGSETFQVCVVSQGDGIAALNLLGEPVNIPQRSDLQSMLSGSPYRDFYGIFVIPICHAAPSAYSMDQRKELWNATVKEILSKTLSGSNLNAWDEEWQRISRPEQTSFEMTQDILLDSMFRYLKQGLQGGLVTLQDLRSVTEEMQRRQFEVERIQDASEREKRLLEIIKQRRTLRDRLRNEIEGNPETQRELLSAVRRKMGQFEYQLDSIPFELFQNADDAAVEWAEMGGSVDAASYSLEAVEEGLLSVYQGRPINVYRRGDFSADQGRQRGFDRDLEKMLVLQMSDKAESGKSTSAVSTLTGKFGLGFKSVFLFADRVLVKSGGLSFAILGGIFPSTWNGQTGDSGSRQPLFSHEFNLADRPPMTTLLLERSAINTNRLDETEKIIGRFRAHAPVLTVFARRIKDCHVGDEVFHWAPVQIPGTQSAFCGRIRLPGEPSVLFLRTAPMDSVNNTGLLLQIDASGVVPLPRDIPTLWVTAPTRDGAVTGYAVNGAFAVDVGRAQLAAGSDESEREAKRIGNSLGQSFLELYDALCVSKVGNVLSAMGLPVDMRLDAFWTSLWKLFAQPVSGSQTAIHLLREILWADARGYQRLLVERETLPTGLPDIYDVLTRISQVRHQVVGIADNHENFERIAAWSGVTQRFPPGTVISRERIAQVLDREGDDNNSRGLISLSLGNFLDATIDGKEITPTLARQFGILLRRRFFAEAATRFGADISEEIRRLRTYLTRLRFFNEAGTTQTANEILLVAESSEPEPDSSEKRDSADAREEYRRAAFAPDNHRLAASYLNSAAAVAFLLACRGERQRRIDQDTKLAEWGRIASDVERQTAFLSYLADGELAAGIAAQLHANPHGIDGTWLEDITETDAFKWLDEKTRAAVVLRLRPAESVAALFSGTLMPTTNAAGSAFLNLEGDEGESTDGDRSAASAVAVLLSREDASEWVHELSVHWARDGVELHRRYDEKTYPDAGVFFAHLNEEPPKSVEARKAWLTLLLRASLESMGRTNASQHRNFLLQCEQRGWLDKLAVKGSEGAGDLIRDFDDWLSEQIQGIEYFHWVRSFLPIAFLVRHLDDYSHTLLGLNETGENFKMLWVDSPTLSESRVRVPPLQPFLGIGTHFVLRELLRKHIVRNPATFLSGFVPVRAVREAASRLGVVFSDSDDRDTQSRAIYAKLVELGVSDATFGFAFDIALRDSEKDK